MTAPQFTTTPAPGANGAPETCRECGRPTAGEDWILCPACWADELAAREARAQTWRRWLAVAVPCPDCQSTTPYTEPAHYCHRCNGKGLVAPAAPAVADYYDGQGHCHETARRIARERQAVAS